MYHIIVYIISKLLQYFPSLMILLCPKHSFYVKIMLNKRTILGRTSFGRLIARETFSNPFLKQGLLRKNCLFTFSIQSEAKRFMWGISRLEKKLYWLTWFSLMHCIYVNMYCLQITLFIIMLLSSEGVTHYREI